MLHVRALGWLVLVLLCWALPARAGVILDLHGVRYPEITSQLPAIRNAGFTAILVSPHQKSCGGGFSDGFDPYDYTSFDSRFGTESELYWMIGTAHWYGIRVYADMVLNHMCPGRYEYPHFSWNDFNHAGEIRDWSDPWWLENGDLFGLADLNHGSGYVRGQLYAFLVKSNSMGFDGYRWDAAKHIPIWFFRDHILPSVNAWGKYSFGEVVSGEPWILDRYVNAGMSVTDYGLYDAIYRNFRHGGDLAQLDGAGYAARNGARALTFVENHDVGPPPNGMLAYAFLAAYPGYPSFYRVDVRHPTFKNLVWIHERLAHGHYIARVAERDVLVFEREGHLVAGFNQSGGWAHRWIPTPWPNAKLNDYTGHTGGGWTNQHGWIEVALPPMGYVMLAP